MAEGAEGESEPGPSAAEPRQRAALMGRDVVGLVAPDLVPGLRLGGVM